MLWDYQEEPDVVPAEKPTQTAPALAPCGQKGTRRPGMTTPWDYWEEPDVQGSTS